MKRKPSLPYNFGFTSQGLGVRHAQALAAIFLESGDWEKAKAIAFSRNAFRQERKTSLHRLEREIRLRLQTLTPAELEFLAEGDSTCARVLSLLAVFKRYRFIRDFCESALRPKLIGFDTEVRPSDYLRFLDEVEPRHPEIAKLSVSTTKKIRQVTLRILTEGELVSPGPGARHITPSPIPGSIVQLIRDDDASLLRAFLIPEEDLRLAA